MGAARYIGRVGGGHVYAQIVDDESGLVVGNTVTVPLENIAYTVIEPGDTLTLQVVGSATPYENFTSVGVINVSSMELALPTVGAAAPPTGPGVAAWALPSASARGRAQRLRDKRSTGQEIVRSVVGHSPG